MRLACTGLSAWFGKASIVTPSRILAAVAARQFSREQLDRGSQAWERPEIFDAEVWLSNIAKESRYVSPEIPALLSPAQERLLWHTILLEEQPDLFDLNATAGLARQANRLIAEWQISLESDFWSDHEDAQQFLRWRKLFSNRCREQNWIARSDLWQLVPACIRNRLCPPEATVFAAFWRNTPALERVKSTLGQLATEIAMRERFHASCAAMPCQDFNQELEEAARWARGAFEQDPTGSIGIFVPDLAKHRGLIERTFQQVFHPGSALDFATPVRDSVFHINASAPLENNPLIASALLLLELLRPRIDQASACAILRSPFLPGAIAERSARGFADLELRKRRDVDASLRDMEFAASGCPLLGKVWSSARRTVRTTPKHLELSAWSRLISDFLKTIGWPGDSELDALERDLVVRWNDTLSNLATLGLVATSVTFDTAIVHLRRLLAIDGPQRGDWLSPIQILDAADAPALEFDSVFLTGLSDEMWPPRLNPNPLIPLKLQQAHNVPASSANAIQLENERATRSLFQSAPVVFATYSGRRAAAIEPFVTERAREYSAWEGRTPRQSYSPASLEEIEDRFAPPYLERQETKGGVGVIKSQSLCPFRAFAEFRLLARAPEEACLGFDARDRGGFAHKALGIVWERLRSRDRLCAISAGELQTIVSDAVVQAVREDQSSPFHLLAGETERERLAQVILEWLEFERARQQPFTVHTVEQDRYYSVPGLHLKLRVDRIDRLNNGKLLLIDYKSSKQTRNKLALPRPLEPQLLVYAAVQDGIDGMIFGEVKAREVRASGLTREKHFIGGAVEVKKDWPSFLECSRNAIDGIAKEFVKGYAAVDPLPKACEYCNLKPLCRVNESRAESEQEDE